MQPDPNENMQPALACNLGAIDPAHRDEHVKTAEHVFASVLETKELFGGYAIRLPLETPMLLKAAAWIANERLCCPFFSFTLVVSGQLWLEISGPEQAKDELINMANSLRATGALPNREAWIAAHMPPADAPDTDSG